ncbi:unnamed protein product [Owenia fusiformis]|uniref:Uncharacterized protein n=1 Tax=Owenia fusiformis TaxID=6347 RepID=A0A8J1UZP0_OWEFU|nr:unnamed protein product [Owenia fusiformis]
MPRTRKNSRKDKYTANASTSVRMQASNELNSDDNDGVDENEPNQSKDSISDGKCDALIEQFQKLNEEMMRTIRLEMKTNSDDIKLAFKSELQDLKKDISYAQTLGEGNKKTLENHETRLQTIEREAALTKGNVAKLSNQYTSMYDNLQAKILDMNVYGRRSSLHFSNIPEVEGEDPKKVMRSFFERRLKMPKDQVDAIRFERVHRIPLGPKSKYRYTRVMTVKFNWYEDRETVWNRRFELKGTDHYITESFPKEVSDNRRMLFPYFKKAKELKLKCSLVADTLIIQDVRYKVGDIPRLPNELLSSNTAMRVCPDSVLYHSGISPLGPDSYTPFECDGTMFRSVTQFMSYNKAISLKDTRKAEQILQTSDPSQMRYLASTISEKDDRQWRKMRDGFLTRATSIKFKVHKHLQNILLGTGSKILGECSPRDLEFGTGCSMNDRAADDHTKWTGQNLGGNELMQIRNQIMRRNTPSA